MIRKVYARTARLTFRDFVPTDAPDLFNIYGNAEVTRYLSFPPRGPEEVKTLIAGVVERRDAKPRHEYALAAVTDPPEIVIGMLRLALDDLGDAQIGFALNPKWWGRGLGKEIANAGLDFAFTKLGVNHVWGARDEANEASKAVLANVGMQDADRIMVPVESADGTRTDRDSPVARISQEQWAQRRGEPEIGSTWTPS